MPSWAPVTWAWRQLAGAIGLCDEVGVQEDSQHDLFALPSPSGLISYGCRLRPSPTHLHCHADQAPTHEKHRRWLWDGCGCVTNLPSSTEACATKRWALHRRSINLKIDSETICSSLKGKQRHILSQDEISLLSWKKLATNLPVQKSKARVTAITQMKSVAIWNPRFEHSGA